jgi:hypothetical protein
MTRWRVEGAVLGAVLLLAAHTTPASAVVLYDNLSKDTAGAEPVSDTRWVAASFATDGDYQLQSATLLLQMTSSGQAELDLYSDVPVDPTDPTQGDMPGSLLATLTSPGSYSSSLASTTFGTNTNVLLNLGTYWLVLKGRIR